MRALIEDLLDGATLGHSAATELLDSMTDLDVDQALAGAALAAMRVRGETPEEIRAFAEGLQQKAIDPEIEGADKALDIVGTGGDGSHSLNLSTGAALLAAAAGQPVIKHGNRSVSSSSGSFDVLVELGLSLPWEADMARRRFGETGFAYLYAPSYHPSMKAIAPVRRSLAARTIFNVVGPLANPARVGYLVVGAFGEEMAATMAQTLSRMDIRRAFVVHGSNGWDEPTPVGPYTLHDVTPGSVVTSVEDPTALGFERCNEQELAGAGPAHNAAALRAVFEGERGPHRDALLLGASLGIRVTGVSHTEALRRCVETLDEGGAAALLGALTQDGG